VTAVVKAESLTKRFGEVMAVTDLSFALEAGTITGFLGPNGAGKTTTLRMILGLAAPTSGRALVFDHPYAALPRAALRIGAVLEATDFHPGRSGRDHLRMLGQAVDVPDSRADEVLRLVELGDAAHRRVKGYSLGMCQRLGLAAALLGDPELLILDEPANGLDPEGVRWLRDFLRRLASEGRTVLISSHVLAEVAQTVDRVLIISRGRFVLSSPLAELTARAGGAVRVRSGDPQRPTAHLRAILQADELDHVLYRARRGVVPGVGLKALSYAELRLDARGLEHHADPRAPPAIGALGVLAEHLDLAGGAFAMALEDFDGGRLPRCVGTEEREDLAARHPQVDAPDRFEPVVGHAQPGDLDDNVSGMLSWPRGSCRRRGRTVAGLVNQRDRHRPSRRLRRGLPERDPFVQAPQGTGRPPVGRSQQFHQRRDQ
jgi:ABC-2 type transport system ATP-binding protein